MDAKDEKTLIKLEEQKSFEEEATETPPADIIAFNELRSCADLLRMYKNEQLEIQPDFQREIVWDRAAQTRFIDSLIKQLPIPSMCISLDYKSNTRQVIDGLQRMSSIINFLSDDEYKLSTLDDIESKISGKTNLFIKSRHSDLYDRVENLTIPITILRCDYTKESHTNYLFTIFHRLNSGGSKLNNQEIRNCVYNGNFNTSLKDLVKSPKYKKLMKIKETKIYRFSNEELALRFFAFYHKYKSYNGRLAKFLNDYMHNMLKATHAQINENEILFDRTVSVILSKLKSQGEVSLASKTTIEGLFIGVAKNIDHIEAISSDHFDRLYQSFRSSREYSFDNLRESLSAKDKVIERIGFSIDNFSL